MARLMHRRRTIMRIPVYARDPFVQGTLSRGDVALVEVSAEEVGKADTSYFESLVTKISGSVQDARRAQGHLALIFPDYDAAEFVFAVPEVRRFVRVLHERVPHLLYFLSPLPDLAQVLEFMAAFSPDDQLVQVGDRMTVQSTGQVIEALAERLLAVWRFAGQVGDDPERVVRDIVNKVSSDPGSLMKLVASLAAR